jgi:hypothetical protein
MKLYILIKFQQALNRLQRRIGRQQQRRKFSLKNGGGGIARRAKSEKTKLMINFNYNQYN